MSDRLKILYDEEPPARRGPTSSLLIGAGCAVIAAWLLLGSIDSPIPDPSELTTPPRVAIAVMPDLRGSSLIGAGNQLRDAGLDRHAIDGARWIANPEVKIGTVSAQNPPAGAEVFDYEEIDLVVSSGGPTITWDQVPATMKDLLNGVARPNPDEPILVLSTEAGNAYKTDDLLFGDCLAVDLTKDSLYDRTFGKLCPAPSITPIVGWLGDGAMYAIDGLPEQDYLDVGSAISLGPDQPLGRQLWSISSSRRAPHVEVDDRTVRITGGFYRFVLKIPEDSELSPHEVGQRIAPLDIRGNLVVGLSPPLSFYPKPGVAGNNSPDGQAARRHREIPGEPFGAPLTVNIVSTGTSVELQVADRYAAEARLLSVPATHWTSHFTGNWQFAYPSGWNVSALPSERSTIMAVATNEPLAAGDHPCGQFPLAAIKNMGVEDVVISVSTSQEPPSREWPSYFDESRLGPIVPEYGSNCLGEVEAQIHVDTLLYKGQSLEVVSAFGPGADESARNQALAILTSLEPIPTYSEG
ncbi:MAG: PASTA domain-containing protein [Acidimicrobiia bacterium]|nr:PASTA domain-containing protein [Acidimicrobiia bacterium]MDH5505424.1 PASTA domain-containing protein [Acidimicrobiia bacterium]